jgi:hypothetical protein
MLQDPSLPALANVVERVDALVKVVSTALRIAISHRQRPMCSVYPPGAHYKMHFDRYSLLIAYYTLLTTRCISTASAVRRIHRGYIVRRHRMLMDVTGGR